MTNCNEMRERISLYIDDELPADELAEFKEHISTCSDCRRECDEIMQIVGLCKDMPEAELPSNFRKELHVKLMAAASENSAKSGILQRTRYIRIISSIAAGLILIFLVSGIYRFGFTNLKTGNSTADISMKAAKSAEPEQPNMSESFTSAAAANGEAARFSMDAGSYAAQSVQEAAPAVDRSSSSENNRITQPALNPSGTADEAASNRTVYLTILVDDPAANVESVKALVAQYGGEEQPQPLLKSAAVAASDTPASNNEIVLTYSIPNKQYEGFTQTLDSDFGKSNIEPGALVSEDLTGTLNSLIERSNVLDTDIKKLEESDSAANADKIAELKTEKETVEGQIDSIRLNTDFTNVTIIIKKK